MSDLYDNKQAVLRPETPVSDLSHEEFSLASSLSEPSISEDIERAIEEAEAVEVALDDFLLSTSLNLNLTEEQFEELSSWADSHLRNADTPAEIKLEAVKKLEDMVQMAGRLEAEGIAEAYESISECCSRISVSLKRGNLNRLDATVEAVEFKSRYPALNSLDKRPEVSGAFRRFAENLPPEEQGAAFSLFEKLASAPGFSETFRKALSLPDFASGEALKTLIGINNNPGGEKAINEFQKHGGWKHPGTAYLLVQSKAISGRIMYGGCQFTDIEAALPEVIKNQIKDSEPLQERGGANPVPTQQSGYLMGARSYEQPEGTVIRIRWHTPEPTYTSNESPVAIVTRNYGSEFLLHVDSKREEMQLARAVQKVTDGKETLPLAAADGSIWIKEELWQQAREKGGIQARMILAAGHFDVDPAMEMEKRRVK